MTDTQALRVIEAPETDIKSIRETETEQTVFDLSVSGWSASRISKHLKKLGHQISVRDVIKYQAHVPVELIIEPSIVSRKMKTLDVYVDAFNEMGKVLLTMASRLDLLLVLEESNPKYFAPLITKITKDYFSMLQDYARLQAEVGEVPFHVPAAAEASHDGPPSVAELRQMLQVNVNVPEQRTDVIEVAADVRELEDGSQRQ